MTAYLPFGDEAIARLTANTEPWLSCDDCFEQVDSAVEHVLGSVAPLTEPFRVHLRGCAACLEEAQSLAALIAEQYDLTAPEAVARLEGALTR